MTTTLKAAAELALEALENAEDQLAKPYSTGARCAITALRAALAEPVRENKYGMKEWEVHALRAGWMPTPPHRKPLTDEEIVSLWDNHIVPVFGKNGINPIVFARAIEAKHGIGSKT